ncbi:uncharacterized protein YqkB [Oikeobacillus pervagus]|uniref:Uncharacterized protein YqkB n=1 Tax=Oikeobacillus pervagus TaxID=1325931 RepID=A0AAJ1SVT6_9BACI|nr:iron-sulfur cluster biosynthesis family protein [Oikeobacillus pervagus]MDQ0213773.1 uncharacterized protein YqkB [Oikeobacillus pervagus]
MKIAITEEATRKLAEKMKNKEIWIKLKYDTEGCGCSVDGVPTLWLVPEKGEDDDAIQTNSFPILVERSKMIFYDEQLTIGLSDVGTFKLSSPNEILNARMNIVERT